MSSLGLSVYLNWTLILVAAAIIPAIVVMYRRQLRLQLEEILSRLGNATTFDIYRRKHLLELAPRGSSGATPDVDPTVENLERLFLRNFAMTEYALPCSMTAVATLVALAAGLSLIGCPLGLSADLSRGVPSAGILAAVWGFIGAYVWGLNDVLRRYRSTDLTPYAINGVWLRMVIAPAIAHLSSSLVHPNILELVALGIGAFPLQTLADIVRTASREQLKLAIQPVPSEAPTLHKLQGATAFIIARLEEEDITSVQQLAYEDPVRLYLRTSLKWNALLDLMDQALLFIYVGDRIEALRLIGARSAIELAVIQERVMAWADDGNKGEYDMVLQIAASLGVDAAAARSILTAIYEDLQVQLVWKLWADQYVEDTPPPPPPGGGTQPGGGGSVVAAASARPARSAAPSAIPAAAASPQAGDLPPPGREAGGKALKPPTERVPGFSEPDPPQQ